MSDSSQESGRDSGSEIRDPKIDDLISAAREVREHARADFSHFKVGAAIETGDGSIFTGCNFENATYGLTICAERVAVFKAISEGARKFRRVAVAADTDVLTPPCGACRRRTAPVAARSRCTWAASSGVPTTCRSSAA